MTPCEPSVARVRLDEAGVAGERGAVVVGLREVGVEGLREALRGVAARFRGGDFGDRGAPRLGRHAGGRAQQRRQRRDQDPQAGELDLPRLELLAQPLRGSSHHQPADEDGQQDVQEDRVQAGADAAEDHLAGGQVGHRHRAADPGVGLDRAVDRPAGGDGRDDVEQRRAGDAEALLLAFHVAPGRARDRVGVQAHVVLRGRAVGLGDVGDDHRAEEHEHHHAVDRVALAAVAGHAPVGEHQRRRDDQHQQHLEQVREAVGVLERVRGVDVEEAAAVGAELLDHLLGGDRAHRDRSASGP